MREKARMLVRESVAPTADELAMAQVILASQPTPAVPMQDNAQTDRALQAVPELVTGGLLADVIAAVASVDPLMGGVDR